MPKENSKRNLPARVNKQPQTKSARRKVISTSSRVVEASLSVGPLPPPETLQQYNNIIQNGAERIMRMAEGQAEHRMSLEKKVIFGDARRSDMGLYIGGFVLFCMLVASFFCIINGHDGAGVAILALDVGGIIYAFIYGTTSRRSERLQKAKIMKRP